MTNGFVAASAAEIEAAATVSAAKNSTAQVDAAVDAVKASCRHETQLDEIASRVKGLIGQGASEREKEMFQRAHDRLKD